MYRQTVGLSVLTCLSEDDKEVHGDSTKLLHYETVAVKVACRLGYDVLWVCTCVCVCVWGHFGRTCCLLRKCRYICTRLYGVTVIFICHEANLRLFVEPT